MTVNLRDFVVLVFIEDKSICLCGLWLCENSLKDQALKFLHFHVFIWVERKKKKDEIWNVN